MMLAILCLALPCCKTAAREKKKPDHPKKTMTQQAEKGDYDIPVRDEKQLAEELKNTCVAAKKNGHPILIEFSAPWCGDCRKR